MCVKGCYITKIYIIYLNFVREQHFFLFPLSVNEQRDAAEYYEKILNLTSPEASKVKSKSVSSEF